MTPTGSTLMSESDSSTAPTVPALQRFSTRGLRESARVELWERHNARALVGLEARTLSGVPLEATETNLTLNTLRFAHVAANAHVVERGASQIERMPSNGVALYFTLYGESFFYCKDGVKLQRPGGLLVCDVSEPFMRGFAQGLREFVITVPRQTFEELTDGWIPPQALTMSFGVTPEANLQAAALARLVRASFVQSSPTDLMASEAHAMALLRSLFSAERAPSADVHRTAASEYIQRHLRDPGLSVAQVARGIGLSERHLSRAFAKTGVGVARVILDVRLDLAHRILSGGGAPSVAEVASHCGFSSHSHFTRVFHDRFGQTPAQLRSSSSLRRVEDDDSLRISDSL